MESEPVLTVPAFTYTDNRGIEHIVVYETLEIPPTPPPPASRNLVYETIEIPLPKPPAPLPVQQYERLYVPPTPRPELIVLPKDEDLAVGKNPEAPYFNCIVLGPHRIAFDYIRTVPVNKAPSGWILPDFSIVLERDIVHIWGTLLHVNIFSGIPSILVGSVIYTGTSSRGKDFPTPGDTRPWTWSEKSKDEYHLEYEETFMVIHPSSRKIHVWDAPEVWVHDQSGIKKFQARTIPRPYPPGGLLKSIVESRKNDNP